MPSRPDKQEQQRTWAAAIAWWRTYAEMEARLTAAVSERMLDLAGVAPGMHVLDIASGSGEPALPAARRVGAEGRVLGTDLIPSVLELARERAAREGLGNVTFEVQDAEALDVPAGAFDVATARWALASIPDVAKALAHLHRALRPGGALVVACWAGPERVAYASIARQVLARFRDVPVTPPEAPGVFRFADPQRLRTVLEDAGFRVDALEAMDTPVVEAPDGAGIVAWVRGMGGRMAEWVGELPEPAQRAWAEQLAEAAEQYRQGDRILLGGTTWLALARR
jgi:ubiquinone/menaquinone biosynthesis C-methylase UbiE